MTVSANSPWVLDQFTRGRVIEKALGGWCNNFPVIDKAENSTQRILEIAIPRWATSTQITQINKAIGAASKLGIKIVTHVIK